MPDVLLATCADLPHGDEDAELLTAALRRAGVDPHWAAWTDPAVDWSAGLTVLRSTWDYTAKRERFLDWVRALPQVANPADVVVWNTDKVYLRDLAAAGVPIVETAFAAPGEPVAFPVDGEVVVKPSVGAGSRGAGRFTADRRSAAAEHAAALHAAGRTVLVQPYLADVDDAGETALIHVDGRFTHAIRKGPMLPAGVAHPVQGHELYVEERIDARAPAPAELEVAAAALAHVRDRFDAVPLYARVDLLPSPAGPVVIELELVEPSLFLSYAADGGPDALSPADLLAAAIAARR
ncbi:RimK family alpha-L-glutamate ligase [uncultured Jatrophihabitans sp.]|uniref:ATP-grasp domain-containing protein n=1 Tax=uncultured Jatrophihabitans sp. TaxID=1610747 RepID=UPI0035CB8A21